ncbi:hypothetical protein PoB_004467600 [Plakobranchus ocellatus]|uniref:Uncharacterized protein n=1 Tax=Plakobranchus ocellatus TaxID=259542 RepID=A0AAV4BCN3_9GAST|nr:hypothetical protein PoB_004467600 [Plakobranchus ocellatus]
MEKELPTSGSGQSAFTVFGFRENRYNNFDTPLENAANVESFNATNSIAFPSRPTQKAKKNPSQIEDGAVVASVTHVLQITDLHLSVAEVAMGHFGLNSSCWPIGSKGG